MQKGRREMSRPTEKSRPAGAQALEAYDAALFAREDGLLVELRQEIERRELPRIHIPPAEGKVLQLLLRAIGARRVLEIGTLGGYSAIWMARALPPDGELITLELEEDRAALAREFLRRARLAPRVEVRVGPAADTLRELCARGGEASFDACFIDADKESYPAYLRWARRLVRVGGLILGDNAHWSGHIVEEPAPDEGTAALQQFNRALARDPGLESTILPVGDGLAVALVTSSAVPRGTSSG